MTRIRYLGSGSYRVVFKDKVIALRKGDIVDVPLNKIRLKKMRLFEDLDERDKKIKKEKQLNDKIKELEKSIKEMKP